MHNELSDRQQAIKLRLAGQSVEEICQIVGRSPAWFHIWWRRYRALGPNGLFDLTRANVQPRRITPDLERSILTIRQRLASQTHPGTRYSLIGASSILAELQVLHVRPLPSRARSNGYSSAMGSPYPGCIWCPFYPTPPIPHPMPASPINSIRWTALVPST